MGSISQLEATSSAGEEGTCMASTSVATTHLSSFDDVRSFSSKLKQLPVATVREKLSFPLRFEKQNFCLDFASVGGSATSDNEPKPLSKGRMWKNPTLSGHDISNQTIKKKKFSSAEKANRRPFGQALSQSSDRDIL